MQYTDTKSLFDADYPSSRHYAVDLSLSENPMGCSEAVQQALSSLSANELSHYPERGYDTFKSAIAAFHRIDEDSLHIGVGASGIVQDILRCYIKPETHVLMSDTTFPPPIFGATSLGGYARLIPLDKEYRFDFSAAAKLAAADTAMVFLCNPNNPTGLAESAVSILSFARSVKCPVVVSEANIEFCNAHSLLSEYHNWPDNLIVLRSFSKAYGLAGLRIGYAIAKPEVIAKIRMNTQLFLVSAASAKAAIAAMKDQAHVEKSVSLIETERKYLMQSLKEMGFENIPSDSNVFVTRLPDAIEPDIFFKWLGDHDANVVPCGNYKSLGNRYIRVAPRLRATNDAFLKIVSALIKK